MATIDGKQVKEVARKRLAKQRAHYDAPKPILTGDASRNKADRANLVGVFGTPVDKPDYGFRVRGGPFAARTPLPANKVATPATDTARTKEKRRGR